MAKNNDSQADNGPDQYTTVGNPIKYAGIDLVLIIIFALVSVMLIYVPVLNQTILRSVFGMVMILFIPGYALIAALFPGKSDIDGIERIALSFGLSIAVVPLIGLGLNFTPWGIRLDPIVICLMFFTMMCVVATIIRRYSLPEKDRFMVDFGKAYVEVKAAIFSDKTSLDKSLTAILIICIVLSIAVTAYVIAVPKQGEKFTEFYILGSNGKADNYPTKFFTGDTKPVIVGIANHEYRDVPYDLVISLNDSVRNNQLYAEHITVNDNQTWEKLINITPDRTGTNMELEFLLYTDGNMTAPYRECHLWINVTSKTNISTTIGAI